MQKIGCKMRQVRIIPILLVLMCAMSACSEEPFPTDIGDGEKIIISSNRHGGYSFSIGNDWQWLKDIEMPHEIESYTFQHDNGSDVVTIVIRPIVLTKQSYLKKDPLRELENSIEGQGYEVSDLRLIEVPGAIKAADARLVGELYTSSVAVGSVGGLEYLISLGTKYLSSSERKELLAGIISSFYN